MQKQRTHQTTQTVGPLAALLELPAADITIDGIARAYIEAGQEFSQYDVLSLVRHGVTSNILTPKQKARVEEQRQAPNFSVLQQVRAGLHL